MYFPPAKAGRTQEPAVRRPGLYEREVLNDFVFPFVGRNAAACEGAYRRRRCSRPPPGSKRIAFSTSTTPRLSAALGHMDGVISLRCYQKFSADYVRAFSRRGKLLWNLHPGFAALSRVMTLFRAMMNGDRDCAVTLHEMDEHWDAGPVIARLPAELRHDLSFWKT